MAGLSAINNTSLVSFYTGVDKASPESGFTGVGGPCPAG